ncbi:MAG: DUF1929 domain-containing protein [Verrucomicrobiota bacterium]|nr:DUF1929 domain-containing protein [Verrucomicrobiota bacterium]
MHVVSDGRVLLAGPDRFTQRLDVAAKEWTGVGNRQNVGLSLKEAPSVMYEPNKVIFIEGGQDPPRKDVELLDLTQPAPKWEKIASMTKARRHHNATLLPDGSVLVTGGTDGAGFNDLAKPVKLPELWTPATGQWTSMAEESVPRQYHSTAVLLPDATVLSGGGGEYRPDGQHQNHPNDSRRNAQIFSPPYLFKSTVQKPRPVITDIPGEVDYGQSFAVQVTAGVTIGMVSWLRLSSVTHAFNMNQRVNLLEFSGSGTTLMVKAPASNKVCPPGHYMLFVLDAGKVPSVGRIIRIK